MCTLVLIGIITLLLLLYLHLTRNFSYWKIRNVPYLKPTIGFGNTYKILMQQETIGQFCHRLYHTTESPYLGFFAFDQPRLLIRSPELVKSVLVKDFEHFSDRSVTTSSSTDFVGNNTLFFMNNPDWRVMRTSMSPVFAQGRLKKMIGLIEEVGNKLVKYIKEKNSPELSKFVGSYAVDVIASCAFGVETESLNDENNKFRLMIMEIPSTGWNRAIQRGCCLFAPFIVNLFSLTFNDRYAGKYIAKLFWNVISARMQSNTYRGDLIDFSLKVLQKQEGLTKSVDREHLVAQAAQYVFAGIDTIELTLLLAIYELGVNRDVQRHLREEINDCLKDNEYSYDNIQKMKYLDMVIKETLRKHPVLPYLDRRCTKDYQLPGTDIVINKGIPIFLSLYGLQMDPEYFPEPEKFKPERFLEENLSSMTNYVYMPFGNGPRNCPGEKFGSLSTKIGLIKIIKNFEVLPTAKTPIPLKVLNQGILIAPDGDFNLQFKLLNN